MDASEFLEIITPPPTVRSFTLGTIKSGKVLFDGEETPSQKEYKILNKIQLNEDDRVLLANVGGTFVILGKNGIEGGGGSKEEIEEINSNIAILNGAGAIKEKANLDYVNANKANKSETMIRYSLNSINIDETHLFSFMTNISEIGHGTMPFDWTWLNVMQFESGHFLTQIGTPSSGTGKMAIRTKYISDIAWGAWTKMLTQSDTKVIQDVSANYDLNNTTESSTVRSPSFLNAPPDAPYDKQGTCEIYHYSPTLCRQNFISPHGYFTAIRTVNNHIGTPWLKVLDKSDYDSLNNAMAIQKRLTALQLQDTKLHAGFYTNFGDGILNNDGTVFKAGWWHIQVSYHFDNNGYGAQTATPFGHDNGQSRYYRTANGTTWNDWIRILDERDYIALQTAIDGCFKPSNYGAIGWNGSNGIMPLDWANKVIYGGGIITVPPNVFPDGTKITFINIDSTFTFIPASGAYIRSSERVINGEGKSATLIAINSATWALIGTLR